MLQFDEILKTLQHNWNVEYNQGTKSNKAFGESSNVAEMAKSVSEGMLWQTSKYFGRDLGNLRDLRILQMRSHHIHPRYKIGHKIIIVNICRKISLLSVTCKILPKAFLNWFKKELISEEYQRS